MPTPPLPLPKSDVPFRGVRLLLAMGAKSCSRMRTTSGRPPARGAAHGACFTIGASAPSVASSTVIGASRARSRFFDRLAAMLMMPHSTRFTSSRFKEVRKRGESAGAPWEGRSCFSDCAHTRWSDARIPIW